MLRLLGSFLCRKAACVEPNCLLVTCHPHAPHAAHTPVLGICSILPDLFLRCVGVESYKGSRIAEADVGLNPFEPFDTVAHSLVLSTEAINTAPHSHHTALAPQAPSCKTRGFSLYIETLHVPLLPPTHPPLAAMHAEILELAFRTGPGLKAHTFESRVRPLTQELCPRAQQAHGITMDELQGADLWPTVASKLVRWLITECRSSPQGRAIPVFIGHNIER